MSVLVHARMCVVGEWVRACVRVRAQRDASIKKLQQREKFGVKFSYTVNCGQKFAPLPRETPSPDRVK